jgi:hypothetical protein
MERRSPGPSATWPSQRPPDHQVALSRTPLPRHPIPPAALRLEVDRSATATEEKTAGVGIPADALGHAGVTLLVLMVVVGVTVNFTVGRRVEHSLLMNPASTDLMVDSRPPTESIYRISNRLVNTARDFGYLTTAQSTDTWLEKVGGAVMDSPQSQPKNRFGIVLEALPLFATLCALIAAILTARDQIGNVYVSALAITGVASATAFEVAKLASRTSRRQNFKIRLWMLAIVSIASVIVGIILIPRISAQADVAGVQSINGGCQPYIIYGQNRWQPYGAMVRATPYRAGKVMGGVSPNELVHVDGWVHTESAQPSNVPPWNSNIWFHLSDGSGWVSFAGTRAVPTPPDPTGLDPNGGTPAPTPSNCEGGLR